MEHENQEFVRSTNLLKSFFSVHKSLGRLFQKTAAENGLTVPQYSVLMFIAPFKKITQKNLGEKVHMPKSTLSQAVDGLVKAGLIHRQQVEGNRREMQLSLSKKGEDLIKTVPQQEGSIHQVFKSACDKLSEKQYEELLQAHLQIKTSLESYTTTEQGECTK